MHRQDNGAEKTKWLFRAHMGHQPRLGESEKPSPEEVLSQHRSKQKSKVNQITKWKKRIFSAERTARGDISDKGEQVYQKN